MSSVSVLQIGEVLQKDQTDPNTKLQVYTWRRTHEKSKDLPLIPTQDQPNSPRDGPKNIPGIPISISTFIVPSKWAYRPWHFHSY